MNGGRCGPAKARGCVYPLSSPRNLPPSAYSPVDLRGLARALMSQGETGASEASGFPIPSSPRGTRGLKAARVRVGFQSSLCPGLLSDPGWSLPLSELGNGQPGGLIRAFRG